MPHHKRSLAVSRISVADSEATSRSGTLTARIFFLFGREPGELRDRTMYLAQWSIAASTVIAVWKILVMVFTGISMVWVANVVFSLGLVALRVLAVTTHRRTSSALADEAFRHRRVYRSTGLSLVVLAGIYIVGCLTLLARGTDTGGFDQYTSITIATLTFTELALALYGLVAARRSADLLVEVVKLGNLAGAVILLVLTQAALISYSQPEASTHTHYVGTLCGVIVALIGGYMLIRRLPDR